MLCWWCQVRMVSSPELLNKYVGESENNLRALFYQAEMDAEQLGSNRYVYLSITCQTEDLSLETLFNILVMWLLLLNTCTYLTAWPKPTLNILQYFCLITSTKILSLLSYKQAAFRIRMHLTLSALMHRFQQRIW